VSSPWRVLAATLAAAAGLCVPAATVPVATAAPTMSIGVYDEGQTFFGNLDQVFSQYKALHVGVLRVNLYWGGPLGVAKHRPFSSSDPRDAAYDWSVYDRTAFYAAASGIKLLFSITGTPRWANGDQSSNRPPRNYALLRGFAYAAAARYSGTYVGNDGRVLPTVRLWAAWNEPNNPNFLRPQFVKEKGKWVIQSARDYAKICNAVYEGVHATLYKGEQVACGVTAPRGNNNPASARPSVSPVAFLTAAKKAGMKRFDAYAHNPYYGVPTETPTTRPPGTRSGQAPTAITLANIDILIAAVGHLYGPRPIWITEYGYQTNPPDPHFGVSWAKQARYLTQAFAVARRNSRIKLMLWFLVRDEPNVAGWQSGLITTGGTRKPAFSAFQHLPH
jgi:Glycosyl hydrolase catalytic core